MPSYQRQHYVPQFLLRNFSSIKGETNINLYNKKRKKVIYNAAIKTQAQEKFYYGDDLTFESYFANVENKIAPVIAAINESKCINTTDKKEYAGLLHFISFFAFRTKANVDRQQEGINAAIKELSKHFDDLQKFDFENNIVRHTEPAAFSIAKNFENWIFVFDLDPFLLINETETDFVISDNPLVIYNPLMQKREKFTLSQGLINKGLLLLFPISPKCCIMLIDTWAYDVFCASENCYVDNIADIDSINLLQAISADQNVFFSDLSQEKYVENVCGVAIEHKVDKHMNEVVNHPFKPGVKALYSYHVMHRLSPDLSFIRESSEAKNYDVSINGNHVRNDELLEWVKKSKKEL